MAAYNSSRSAVLGVSVSSGNSTRQESGPKLTKHKHITSASGTSQGSVLLTYCMTTSGTHTKTMGTSRLGSTRARSVCRAIDERLMRGDPASERRGARCTVVHGIAGP